MGKIFATIPGTPIAPAAQAFDLWDVTTGCDSLTDKPRPATKTECIAYLDWLAARDGVFVPRNASYSEGGIFVEGRGKIVAMPGYGQDRTVMLETTDDDGNVVRTSRIGTDSKGHMRLKADAVRDACALPKVTKPRKTPAARKPKAAPVAPTVPVVDPALMARVAALEAIVARLTRPVADGKRVRSEGERRAIIRAWRIRCEARQRADLDRRALLAANKAATDWQARCEAATARADKAEAMQDIAVTMTKNVVAARSRTASRLIAARATARTARRERIGIEAGLAQAQATLARYQPLIDAMAAFTAPPASLPLADNVVPLHAAR